MLDGTTGGQYDIGRRLYFAAAGRTLSAEIEDPSLLEQARRFFPLYEVSPPSVEPVGIPDVRLQGGNNRYTLTARSARSVVCRTQTEALSLLELELTRALLESFGEYLHLHAAGAVVNGKAVLALGKSGAGKSSLALSWVSRNLPTLGDDIVLLNYSANAQPFKRLLKVSPVALEAACIDPATTVQWDPDWPEAWYDPADGPGWAAEAPVAVIAVVRYNPDASLTLTPMSSTEALNMVIHSVMDTGLRPADCFDTLVRLVGGHVCFVWSIQWQTKPQRLSSD